MWIALVLISARGTPSSPNAQTTVFGDHPNSAEMWIAKADGVHFAQLAADPLYRDTVHNFRDDPARASYRSLRPVQGWVDWAASLGARPALLAPAILALTAAAVGLLPVAVSSIAAIFDRATLNPLLVLATPGVLANLWAPGMSEPLAALIVLVAATAWLRDRRSLAVALFCVAALTKETTLAVPAGIAIAEILATRRVRGALPLLLAPASYLAWSSFVASRVGPVVTDVATTTGWQPITGLLTSPAHWSAADAAGAAAVAVSLIMVLRLWEPVLTAIALAHLVMVSCLGTIVWMNWWGIGRAVLPLSLLALVGEVEERHREPDRVVGTVDEPDDISPPAPATV